MPSCLHGCGGLVLRRKGEPLVSVLRCARSLRAGVAMDAFGQALFSANGNTAQQAAATARSAHINTGPESSCLISSFCGPPRRLLGRNYPRCDPTFHPLVRKASRVPICNSTPIAGNPRTHYTRTNDGYDDPAQLRKPGDSTKRSEARATTAPRIVALASVTRAPQPSPRTSTSILRPPRPVSSRPAMPSVPPGSSVDIAATSRGVVCLSRYCRGS
ncbi:uncharacterized protein B0H18DRAFT_646375 [Fomitopsis serialis]|uniref:uncharacterized protein n=1 Tax=Fomitopsis serialis TaxID=139415 RepID=UPI002008A193|nr:uncharacterized protein B0H18DRAFT_646375 [Neoantrodia serialis]KAH9933465.1 hypothetical protein B0H18DRAFT_646375 [Neoantrodia serialis]